MTARGLGHQRDPKRRRTGGQQPALLHESSLARTRPLRLRKLVPFLDKKTQKIVYTDFQDQVIDVRDEEVVHMPTMTGVQYAKKVKDYLRSRTAHLTACFGRDARAAALTTYQIRQYQLARRAAGAATGTINRETSALHRMCTLAVHWGWLDTVPGFPDRLRENPPRQGFFEHPEYLAVRAHLPAPWQDILDLAYYSGWRKNEILGLTWDELDEAGGVIRLSPARSKTLVGRILPISQPIAEALARRRARRDPDSPLVFHRDGIPVRRWRTAWRTACQAAGVPTRFLHDCRRTAARNLIRASVPERVAMLLTGHKTRAIFDRYNIINEQELLEAGDQLVAYLAQHAQATPRGGRPHPARTAAPRTAPPLRLVRRTTA